MPVNIWNCHESFWESRRFVVWQLLRRNETYRRNFSNCPKDGSVLLATRSYAPDSADESLENWKRKLRLFIDYLRDPRTNGGFNEWLSGQTGHENWATQTSWGEWLDKAECQRDEPYQDLYLCTPEMKLATPIRKCLKAMGVSGDDVCVGGQQPESPWNPKYTGDVSFIDPAVDFPPWSLLPRFAQQPPPTADWKAYGAYLYDKMFEPFKVGRGPIESQRHTANFGSE